MANFTNYKGFKIESGTNGCRLWGKKFFEPLDTVYANGSLKDCKKMANTFLRLYNLKTWPVLFPDVITKC